MLSHPRDPSLSPMQDITFYCFPDDVPQPPQLSENRELIENDYLLRKTRKVSADKTAVMLDASCAKKSNKEPPANLPVLHPRPPPLTERGFFCNRSLDGTRTAGDPSEQGTAAQVVHETHEGRRPLHGRQLHRDLQTDQGQTCVVCNMGT